jgi:hypothetical protein
MEHDVDGVTFTFADSWETEIYDKWPSYLGKLQAMEAKGVDVIAVHDEEAWLIEVKDYTNPQTERIPLADLPKTIAAKCLDTLGGLVTVSRDQDVEQRAFAAAALGKRSLRVVLHVEIPQKTGRLSNPKSVQIGLRRKLRQAVKAIDPHALIHSREIPADDWVTRRTVP